MPTNKENKVQFGLSEAHYAKCTYDSATKTYTYATPKAYPGMVNLNLPAEVAELIKYADNIAYYRNIKNNGFNGDLETVLVPDDFKIDIHGAERDETTGDILENSDALSSEFAFLFKINGDPYDRKFVLYRCTAGRPAIAAQTTEENIDIPNQTMSLAAMPRENDHFIVRSCYKGSPNYDNWFGAVVEPPAQEQTAATEDDDQTDQTGNG